jgi:ADYC domain/Pentapeptide repeats (8 copies)
MTRFCIICFAALCASYCSSNDDDTAAIEQAGTNLQGSNLQGSNLQGMSMQGFQLSGATLGGDPLVNLRIEQGEVVAEQNQITLHGASLVGAHLYAQARNLSADPPDTALVEYRITGIVPEDGRYDPTNTGATFLYTLEQWFEDTGAWLPACPVDLDGRQVAIPLAATWDEHGDRIESTSLFTLACTSGVIAKCYRWGYRPWATGYGDLATMHWACTRMARADYCGNGVPHTQDGTWINLWDHLPAPGPIQQHGLLPPLGMVFEGGWNTHGAACLNHTRWPLNGGVIAAQCPDRLIPPALDELTCDVAAALGQDPAVYLFTESYLLP